jgi:hypothetical protein
VFITISIIHFGILYHQDYITSCQEVKTLKLPFLWWAKHQKISVLNVKAFKMREVIASASPLTCSEHCAYLKLCIHHLVEVEV